MAPRRIPRVEVLPLDAIKIDESYYRPATPWRVAKIRRGGWNRVASGALAVNQREDGDYYLLDGRHRLTAARAEGLEEITALVYSELPREEEIETYILMNMGRVGHTSAERLKAEQARGEEEANEFTDLVTRSGYTIVGRGERSQAEYQLTAVAEALLLFRRNAARLEEALALAHQRGVTPLTYHELYAALDGARRLAVRQARRFGLPAEEEAQDMNPYPSRGQRTVFHDLF